MEKIWNVLYAGMVFVIYVLFFLWWAFHSQPEDKREHKIADSEVVEINKVTAENKEQTI